MPRPGAARGDRDEASDRLEQKVGEADRGDYAATGTAA